MITVLTAYTPETIYEEIALENQRRCEAFGYRFRSQWIGYSEDLQGVVPPCAFKPHLMLDELRKPGPGGMVVWMDADAVLLRRIDEMQLMADLVVTIRDREQIGASGRYDTDYLNSGIVGFSRTLAGRALCEMWVAGVEQGFGDQESLNRLFGPSWTPERWKECVGKVQHSLGRSRVALPCRTWNYIGLPAPIPADARVVHFRHGLLEGKPRTWWRSKITEALAA